MPIQSEPRVSLQLKLACWEMLIPRVQQVTSKDSPVRSYKSLVHYHSANIDGMEIYEEEEPLDVLKLM